MLAINEVFESVQDKGKYRGVKSVFVCLQGCAIKCEDCGIKHVWHVESPNRITAKEMFDKTSQSNSFAVVEEIKLIQHILGNFKAKHIVITGGEPLSQDINQLISLFEYEPQYQIEIETSGVYSISDIQRQVHVSITHRGKRRSPEIIPHENYDLLNEFRFVINDAQDSIEFDDLMDEYALDCPIYISPGNDLDITRELCVAASKFNAGVALSLNVNNPIALR